MGGCLYAEKQCAGLLLEDGGCLLGLDLLDLCKKRAKGRKTQVKGWEQGAREILWAGMLVWVDSPDG